MTKVLVIEDSDTQRAMLCHALEQSGHTVASADTGGQGLRLMGGERPDIVLLDVVMPDMDGVTLLTKLREHDATARIIMVSSLGTKEKVMECMEKGAANFLMKPYDKDGLVTVLRAAGGGARA